MTDADIATKLGLSIQVKMSKLTATLPYSLQVRQSIYHNWYRSCRLQAIETAGCVDSKPYILQTMQYADTIQSADRTFCRPYSLQTIQSTDYIVCLLVGLSAASLVWELASPLPQKKNALIKMVTSRLICIDKGMDGMKKAFIQIILRIIRTLWR